ncbi:MAG: hypothetical protein KY396_09250 [Actinobacteria bacterium]|nr:hypothetical protein [Actinomycetota bacterium]
MTPPSVRSRDALAILAPRRHDLALFLVTVAGAWSAVLIFLVDRTLWRALLGLVVAFAVVYVVPVAFGSWVGAWVWKARPKIEAELAASRGLTVGEWRSLPKEERDGIIDEEIEARLGAAT